MAACCTSNDRETFSVGQRSASGRLARIAVSSCATAGVRLCLLLSVWLPLPAQQYVGTGYAQAEALIRSHRWDMGIEVLQPMLKESPANLRLLNLAGLAYTGKGNLNRADEYFKSALKIDPGFVPALKNLGINEAGRGQIASAISHLQAALKEAPDDPVANLYLGGILYRERDFVQAVRYLREARELASRNPDVLATLAVAELKTGQQQTSLELIKGIQPRDLRLRSQIDVGIALAVADLFTQAIPYLEAARAASPAAVEIGYDLALCYVSVKRFGDAITTLQSASEGGHETSENDNLLAEAYEANHETQNAVDALRRAIVLSPRDQDNYLDFASICLDHEDFGNAAKVLEVGLSLQPHSAQLLFERGILNAMQDRFELAEKDFQEAANLAPQNSSGIIGLGVTLMESGNSAKAIPVLRDRLKGSPKDANLCYLLGEALLRTGVQQGDPAYVEAQVYLEKAVALDTKLVEPHISLGTIYLAVGRLEDAVAQLERARLLDQKAKSAYSHLAIAYRRLGQQDKSKMIMTELKDLNDLERTGSRQPLRSQEAAPEPSRNSILEIPDSK